MKSESESPMTLRWERTEPGEFVPVVMRFALPYCIHLQDRSHTIRHRGRNYTVVTEKIWRSTDERSEDDSVYDELRYHPSGTIVVGPIGVEPSERQTVPANMELALDPLGKFRFTRVTIALTHAPGVDMDPDALFREAVSVVNTLVDAYRYASGRAYLPPFRTQDIEYVEVELPLSGEIFYHSTFRRGLTLGLVNETRDVHDRFERIAASGIPVPIHAELMLTAERMRLEGAYRQSIVEAVVALEVYVADLLHRKLVGEQGMSEEDYLKVLQEDGQVLSDQMKKPMRRALGKSPADDQQLWQSWLEANQLRRGVVHDGQPADDTDARSVIGAAQALLRTLDDEGRHLDPPASDR